MLTVSDLVGAMELELAARRARGERADPLGPRLGARRPDAVALGRRAAAEHGHGAARRGHAARLRPPARRAPPRRPRASASASPTRRCPRRSSTRPARSTSRCSPCPTRCRSSRSPSAPSRAWSTSSSTCSSAPSSIQRRMERLVLEERSLGEVVRGLANSIGATVMVLDARRAPARLARLPPRARRRAGRSDPRRGRRALARAGEPRGFVPQTSELGGRAIALPVPSGCARRAASWLVAVPEADSVADYERFLAHHAVMVVALAQMRERVVAETERRLAGDVLGLVLSGRLDADEVAARLAPVRDRRATAAVLVLAVEDPDALEGELEQILAELGAHALVATVATARRRLLCAVLAGADGAAARSPRGARERLARRRAQRARGDQPQRAGRGAAAQLPRGALRARGRRARERLGAGGRLAPTISAPTGCCSRCRTTTACGSTATTCCARSSARAAATATSCCARSRRSSSTTATGRRRRARCSATATRCATGCRAIEELTGPAPRPRREPDRVLARAARARAARTPRRLMSIGVEGTSSNDTSVGGAVRVGIPSETKVDEYRVSMTPAGVRELTERGHEVLVQAGRRRGERLRRRALRGAGRDDRAGRRRACSPPPR